MTKSEAIERAKKNRATMGYLKAYEPEVYKVLVDAYYEDRLMWNKGWLQDNRQPICRTLTLRLKPDYQPPLSKDLPEVPDGIEVPDGCTYVGFGDKKNSPLKITHSILKLCGNEWFSGHTGFDPKSQYAIRNGSDSSIWARFGLERPVFAAGALR